MEDNRAEVDEGDYEKKFKRVNDVVAELGRGEVEPAGKSSGEAEDGGASEDGIDADEQAEGDAPGKLLG